MLQKIMVMVLCVAFLAATSVAFAEDVYATKKGKKYHKEDCRFIKNRDAQKVNIEDAQAKGLMPCGRCFADEQQQSKLEQQVNDGDSLACAIDSGTTLYH
ncbi:hypothetical protein ACFL38_03055 [Candidatus Omnitrophota bacterium]